LNVSKVLSLLTCLPSGRGKSLSRTYFGNLGKVNNIYKKNKPETRHSVLHATYFVLSITPGLVGLIIAVSAETTVNNIITTRMNNAIII
jgi:hypothetical protein